MSGADTPNGGAPQARAPSPALKIAVIGMGVLIVAMTALLILGLTLGWNKKGPPPQSDQVAAAHAVSEPAVLEIETAPESRLYTLAGDGTRVALHIAAPTGDEIIVVDTAANRVLSRIRLKPKGGTIPTP